MARQVQQMFPRYPLSTIISDLQLSHSMEVTIDNILEGRLLPPPRHEFDDDDAFGDYMAVSNEAPSTSDTNAEPNTANGSADIGYEIERSTNIFGNQNDLLRDDGYVQVFYVSYIAANWNVVVLLNERIIKCVFSLDK